jgi:hypothetical protein
MGRRRKVRKCRICKKRPVWRGGDVKNPGPYCKRCYHKHVWSGGKGGGRQAPAGEMAMEPEYTWVGQPSDWMEIEMIHERNPDEPITGEPESTDDDEFIPF